MIVFMDVGVSAIGFLSCCLLCIFSVSEEMGVDVPYLGNCFTNRGRNFSLLQYETNDEDPMNNCTGTLLQRPAKLTPKT